VATWFQPKKFIGTSLVPAFNDVTHSTMSQFHKCIVASLIGGEKDERSGGDDMGRN